MVWVRIDDHFDEHPKIARLSDSAVAIFVAGLAYCNRNLTDGFIPGQVGLGKLRYCDGNAMPAIRELEEVGLWGSVEGGWQIHDFEDYQPTKEQVLRDREAKREAGRKGGKASAQARASAGGQADAQAPAQAESKPVPVPVPEGSNEPSRARKRATQLPKSWTPTEKHAELATEMGARLEVEAEQFRDYHRAKGSTYKDWDAAFRTWLRNTRKYGSSSPNGQKRPKQDPVAAQMGEGWR